MTRGFSVHQLHTLRRLGDILIPGDGDLPSFSASKSLGSLGTLLESMDPRDRKALGRTLLLAARFSTPPLRIALKLLERSDRIPGRLGVKARKVWWNLRRATYALYYSNPAVLEKLGYTARVLTDDLGEPRKRIPRRASRFGPAHDLSM